MSRPARSTDRRGPLALWLFAAVLLVAALLRAQVVRSIPEFFGPGDPAIYFGMARGVLHHGVARVDFIHHFLSRPRTIAHVEDYYEPAYAYLPALAMLLGGERHSAALWSSFALGVIGVWLVWKLARRDGAWPALLAGAIVAFEPWSIYYSGVLMKEAAVSVVVLAFLECLRRGVTSGRASVQTGFALGLATIAAGLFQYELIPILGITSIVTLARHRPASLIAYLASSGTALAALAGVTWLESGVLISAKYAFVLGHVPGDPDQVASAAAAGGRTLWPFPYLGRSVLTMWYPTLLLLAVLGAFSPRTDRVERTLLLTFLASHLYLHAIPQDLWSRDFIVLTAVLARPAALALWAPREWWLAGGRTAPLWALLFFLWAAGAIGRWVIPALAHGATWGFWAHVGLYVVLSIPAFLAAWGVARSRFAPAWARLTPIVVGLALAADFEVSLPYQRIFVNAEFPTNEIERARRERVCHWMAGVVPRAPVIARNPEEVEWYSGFPAVQVPEVFHPGGVGRLVARYGIRYLLDERGSIPDSVIASLPVQKIGEREGCRLYALARQ
jgi:hypothetical protein